MSKALVAYFSASGVTADAAKKLAEAEGADLYEITPETPYTAADLDYTNRQSRSTLEMTDPASRPALADRDAPIAGHDTIFLGFPIWWGTAPRIVNTFLESHDFSGKTVVLFATSGSSGFGKTAEDLKKSAAGADIREGVLVHSKKDEAFWTDWAQKNP